MSADPCIASDRTRSTAVAESIYFGADEGRLFGWLHRPSAESNANMGVVICPPFGYEAICSHRAVRQLAEASAAAGIPALRFDYRGTGDSMDIPADADQFEIWSQDIQRASGELQRQTGVSRICLLGFRMGALLAAHVASRCKSIQCLALIAPVTSGRRYLRELRTTRMAGMLLSASQQSLESAKPDDAAHVQTRFLEVSGFSLSASTLASLERIDLAQVELPLSCNALVIDGSSFPAAKKWADDQSKLGRNIKYASFPKVLEMMITAPQYALTSPPMVAATSEWLTLQLAMSANANRASSPTNAPQCAQSTRALTLPAVSQPASNALTERPVFFGPEAQLFGIVSEPAAGENRRRAVILLNAGADHHVGPSRIYVSVARRWAGRGYFVLRMDLGGLGDSGTRSGCLDDEVFPPSALDDIRAAVEFMKSSYGIRDITLAGLCSGAYHTLRAAVAGMPVARIFLVNPQNFFWKDGSQLQDLQLAEVIQNPSVYRQRVLSGAAWKRLLAGEVKIWRIVRIYARRSLLPLESILRNIARRIRLHLPHDLGWELEELVDRGVRLVFVFAHGEPGLELLKLEGGSSVKRLGSKCKVRIIERADHVFSHSGPRATLEEVLSEELFARAEFHVPQGGP